MKNMTKKILSLLVIISVVFTFATFANAASTMAEAEDISFGAINYGDFTATEKSDYYKFTLTSYSIVEIGIKINKPYTIIVYNEAGQEVWKKEVKLGFLERPSVTDVLYEVGLDAGNYFLKIEGSSEGNYTFKVTYKVSTKPPANVDLDKNNSIADAKHAYFKTTTTGKLLKEGEEDFFKFKIYSAGSVEFKMLSKMKYYCAYLLDANGNQLWSSERNEWDSSKKQREDTYNFELSAGTYYLKINGYRSNLRRAVATGEYQFDLKFYSAGVNEVEPNGSFVEARAINLNSTVRGHLSMTDGADYYEISVAKGGVAIGFVSNMSTYNISIYDYYRNEKLNSGTKVKGSGDASRSDVHKITLEEGKYYIKVTGGTGKYSFKVSQNVDIAKVATFKGSSSVTYVSLKWSKVANASGYEVSVYDEAKKSYVKVGATTKRSLKLKKLNGGTTYKFKVKAFKKINGCYLYGEESDELTLTTKPAKVSIKSVVAGAKKATVKWNVVNGASGYRIYYSVDRDFETVKKITVKDGKEASKVIENLKRGKKYYFRVRAFKNVDGKNVWGKYSNTKSVTVK